MGLLVWIVHLPTTLMIRVFVLPAQPITALHALKLELTVLTAPHVTLAIGSTQLTLAAMLAPPPAPLVPA
jgi:hypothetical protein